MPASVSPSKSSSTSSSCATLATAAMLSESLILIKRTPCVARPITLKSSTAILIVNPDLFIIIKSFESSTFLIATKLPVFSEIFKVFTPLPPLLVTL